MTKFGFAAIVASGLTAGLLGVASPIPATASADGIPVIALPGYTTGSAHREWIDTIQPPVITPQADRTARQSR